MKHIEISDLRIEVPPSYYACDDVLFPALLLLVGPPPKKGLRLRPGATTEFSPANRYVARGWAAMKYKREIDVILRPMAHEVFAAYKYNSRCKKACQRRNEFILWVLEKKA